MRAFYDRRESEFYGDCVEEFLHWAGRAGVEASRVVELGVGSGQAMCRVLGRPAFQHVRVDGYEIDHASYLAAVATIEEHGLSERFRVCHGDFFAHAARPGSAVVVSNPPYLPRHETSPAYPVLSSGPDGNTVINGILRQRFPAAMLLLSSYSDPVATLLAARGEGYELVRWTVLPVRLGDGGSQPPVRRRIAELAAEGRAFIQAESYLVFGVTWQLRPGAADLTAERLLIETLLHFGRLAPATPIDVTGMSGLLRSEQLPADGR